MSTPHQPAPVPTPAPAGPDERTSSGVVVLQGMAMGVADVIPGVSGGTVALILGIYTRLIAAIRTLASAPVALLRGDRSGALLAVRAVPWGFVLPLAGGLFAALGIGSVVLPPLLERYPVQMASTFFGMILASLAVPWAHARSTGERTGGHVALAVLMGVLAFLVMGLPELAVETPPLWRVFLSAMVAICAMILPGVSGAFLLLALGVYEPTLEALRDLDLPYILTFAAGAAIGLGSFARLLHHLLDRHLGPTMAALTGLMAGALRVLWPWGGAEGRLEAPPDLGQVLLAGGFLLLGFALVRLLLVAGRRAPVPTAEAPTT